jgi:hypothetical protein
MKSSTDPPRRSSQVSGVLRFGHQLELHWPASFLLNDRRAVPDGSRDDDIANLHLTMSQPRSLLSITKLNNARSRNRRCLSRKKRIARTSGV